MVTKKDYSAGAVRAAHSVLIELIRILGEYRDHIVLVGGWVPDLLFENPNSPHIGSIDVDLALDHRNLKDEGYSTIRELLLNRGYEESDQPFIFKRKLIIDDIQITVNVDFLAGEYGGTGKRNRHQQIPKQGMRPRKARGCDLAFNDPKVMTIAGELPGGGKDSITVRIASVVPFMIMKAMALYDRLKEKDAWDIYYCIQNYPGGMDALVDEFKPYIEHGLVKEGLQKIAEKFVSVNHVGPKFVSDFEAIEDAEEREILERDVFEKVNYLLEGLGVK